MKMIAVVFTAGLAWLLIESLIPQLRLWLLDHPNARSSHRDPTPRGGGLVFVVIAAAASGIDLFIGYEPSLVALFWGSIPLAAIGLLDDLYNLSALLRYAVQLMTAAFLISLSPLVHQIFPAIVAKTMIFWPLIVLLLIAITAMINFVNFMDGLDGLVAGCMAIALSAAAVKLELQWPLWALVGALLGFLIFNWEPSRVFMGDVGSTFLGSVFAGVVLQANSLAEALGLLLLAAPLLADACICICRRILAGQPIFQPHRLHLCQRLHQAGWSHANVSTLYIVATLVLALMLLLAEWPLVLFTFFLELFLGFWLDQRVALPFSVASQA